MEPIIEITKTQLATALQRWDEEAKAANWPERDDPQRHTDNAEYLFKILTAS